METLEEENEQENSYQLQSVLLTEGISKADHEFDIRLKIWDNQNKSRISSTLGAQNEAAIVARIRKYKNRFSVIKSFVSLRLLSWQKS